MNNSIALIIAYYNGSEFIEEAIKSALRQTLPFDEIILVDDGSKDGESQFVLNLASKYEFKYIKKENGGQGSARNAGCKDAKSEYVCFLDQDDILLPDHNAILINEVKNQPTFKRGTVYGNFAVAQSNGNIVSRKSRPTRNIDSDQVDLYQLLNQDIFILPSASIIYRESLLSVNGFDEQFRGYEDDDLFIRLFRGGYPHSFVDEEVYIWRMHENQTSFSQTMLKSRVKFINKWLDNDYDKSINVGLVYQSLYDRFKMAILKDIVKAQNKDAFVFAKTIARDFSKKFKNNQRLHEKLAFFIFDLLPQKLLAKMLIVAERSRLLNIFRQMLRMRRQSGQRQGSRG
jgi:glycosyltransferase involved in cell wall biosynthesis